MGDSKIKLVVSDMDGTLLNSKGELPPDFLEIFSRMQKCGAVFAAASGRQMFNIKTKFPQIENEIYFIAENGAYATYRDETLIELSISREDVAVFRKIAKTIPNTHIVLSAKKQAYIETHDKIFLERLRSYAGHLLETTDVSKIEDDVFFKFTLCDFENPLCNSLKHFIKFSDRFCVLTSGERWMDITHKDSGKAHAVKLIQKRLNISPEETIVFGDYLNDLQMIKDCPNSYAMANAHPDIKQAAAHGAPSNDECGVTKILSEIFCGFN